jgi:hypothetical protein
MIKGCPNALESGSVNNRASMSGELPAGKPTMMRTGLVGHAGAGAATAVTFLDCAKLVAKLAGRTVAAAKPAIKRRRDKDDFWEIILFIFAMNLIAI